MIKISKTNLKTEDKRMLFYDCGGLCSICCEKLDYDKFSRARIDVSEYAHIIGDSDKGPRGNKKTSALYSGSIENIILLCPRCHTNVDKNTLFYTEKRLHKCKTTHILRVRKQLEALKNVEAFSVKYEAPIGGKTIKIDEDKMQAAIAESGFISHEIPISLNPNNTTYSDDTLKFWGTEIDQLSQNYKNEIDARLKRGDVKPFLLFAIAPQPLLIKLGTLMNDTLDIKTFQKRREPDTWTWEDVFSDQEFQIIAPEKIYNKVAVKLSLSDRISDDRVIDILGADTSIWEITHSNPHNDFLKHPSQLGRLREYYREFFRMIRATHGQNIQLNVFPASPISAAIEFGRVWMPKADADLLLYDQNKSKDDNKFVYAFSIVSAI